VKRWSAVINHSRASGKKPLTAEIDSYGALETYLSPESEVIQITIYKSTGHSREARTRSSPESASVQPVSDAAIRMAAGRSATH
jgi:hypothetical protein